MIDQMIANLRAPCGRTTGHGDSCDNIRKCGTCEEKARAADLIEKLVLEHDTAIGLLAEISALDACDQLCTQDESAHCICGARPSDQLGDVIARANQYLKGTPQ